MLVVQERRPSKPRRTRTQVLSPCVAVLALAAAAGPAARAASILNDGTAATAPGLEQNAQPAPGGAVTTSVVRAAPTQAVALTAGAIEPGLGLPPADAAPQVPPTDPDTTWLRPPVAERDSSVMDQLVDRIRQSYESFLSPYALDADAAETAPADIRRHLATSLPPPPADPDAYRYRPIADIQPSEDRNTMTRGGPEASLSLSVRDGQRVYTYRDTAGNVIHEGPLETSEDRRNVPIEVWKLLYEMENTKTEPSPHAKAP